MGRFFILFCVNRHKKNTFFSPFFFLLKERKTHKCHESHKGVYTFSVSSSIYLHQPEDYLFLKFPHELLKVQNGRKKEQIEYQDKVIMAREDVRRSSLIFLFPLFTYSYCNNHFPIDEVVSFIPKLKHHTEYCNSQNTGAENLALIWRSPRLKYYNLRHCFLKYKQFNFEDRYAVFLSINIKFLHSIIIF